MVRVKICGIRSIGEALCMIEAGADALGFHIGLVGSKCPIASEGAAQIISKLPPLCSSVLVTTLSDPEEIGRIARATGATTIQFHGEASGEDMKEVRTELPYLKTYKVVNVDNESAIVEAQKYEGLVDAIILDSAPKGKQRGGTGETHDWQISRRIVESVSLPVILAGGLNPDNVIEAIRIVRPYAVDVNSGVSDPDGTKNLQKVGLFIERAKSAI